MCALSLHSVIASWTKVCPELALGGRRALDGFSYQLSVSLLEFVHAVRRGYPAECAFDSLSDVAIQKRGLLYLVQVKATLTKRTLQEAVAEFLKIDEFMEEAFPEDRERIRFRVACRSVDRKSEFPELDASYLRLDGSCRQRWAQMRHRYDGHIIEASPSLRLAQALWQDTRDPWSLIDCWHGQLMHLLAQDCSPADVAEKLLKTWQEWRLTVESPEGLLILDDFALRDNSERRVLVGERPRLEDLRCGCFMDRPVYVSRVLEQVRNALHGTPQRRNVQVIWISGGAGVGKSTILLQVLNRLLENDIPVHFLQSFVTRLPEALALWRKSSRQVVIAVDDLYGPRSRESGLWLRIVSEADLAPSVVILACGPADDLEEFKVLAADSGVFHVSEIPIEYLDEQELQEYLAWHSRHTGALLCTGVDERNFVLAACHLELIRKGSVSLESFAARLRGHLEADLDQACALLSLSRLGIDAPSSMLAQYGDLEKVLISGAFIRKRVGFFCMHSKVADALYKHLRGHESVVPEVKDLVTAFGEVLCELAQARAVIQALGSPEAVSEDATRQSLAQISATIINRDPSIAGIRLLWDLYKTASTRSFDPVIFFDSRRLDQWLLCVGQLLPADWGNLWQLRWDLSLPNPEDQLFNAGVRWLEENPTADSWHHVWSRCWKHKHTELLLSLGHRWLAVNSDRMGWSHIWQPLFDSGYRNDWMFESVRTALAAGPATKVERHIWRKASDIYDKFMRDDYLQDLIKRIARIGNSHLGRQAADHIKTAGEGRAEQVADALEANYDGPGWPYLWQSLLDSCSTAVEERYLSELGRTWLQGREDMPEWSYVWRRLLKLRPSNRALQEMGYSWLHGREDRPEWNYNWQLLSELGGTTFRQRSPQELGRDWLHGREDKPEWAFVWECLLKSKPEDVGLQKIGRSWLEGREENPGWSFVWEHLVNAMRQDQEILMVGNSWLQGHEDQLAWPHVWECLVDSSPPSEQLNALQDMGRTWLNGRESRNDWNYIWQRLIRMSCKTQEREMLYQIGRRWVEVQKDTGGWLQVFRKLLELTPDDLSLQALGRSWMKEHEDHRDWSLVWECLAEVTPTDRELFQVGRAWLRGREQRPDSCYVLKRLLRQSQYWR